MLVCISEDRGKSKIHRAAASISLEKKQMLPVPQSFNYSPITTFCGCVEEDGAIEIWGFVV